MEIKRVTVSDPHGLHMREAVKVAELARKHKSKAYLCHKCKFANACSILEMVTLEATNGVNIAVIADGPDEKEVIENICKLFVEKI
ncbi:MAG: HPr family phosphocarrier protein [Candidatus Schekmanbacteria bacterium]|nr:HPr family phosphocarrier protein [Candidatus Schekmanbacteria bacterium]